MKYIALLQSQRGKQHTQRIGARQHISRAWDLLAEADRTWLPFAQPPVAVATDLCGSLCIPSHVTQPSRVLVLSACSRFPACCPVRTAATGAGHR